MTRGTIIRITETTYLPQIGAKKWAKNFGEVQKLVMLKETPRNNGTARIIYSDGKPGFINAITDKYEIVRR